MKKLLAIISATLLTLTLFTACTTEKTESPTTTEVLQNTNAETTAPTNNISERTTYEDIAPSATTAQAPAKTPDVPPSTQKPDHTKKKPAADAPVTHAEPATTVANAITKEKAKSIVLAHAGLNESEIKYYRIEPDRERGTLVYEIEFNAGKHEYDYEVNAENGKIIKAEKELRD